MDASLLVIGCGALASELAALRDLSGWDRIDVECLPPELHDRPERIPGAVRERLEAAADRYEKVFVAYADCGTGGALDALLAEYGIERLPGAHCYEVYAGAELFARLADREPGTFYLTDFLARQFDRLVFRGLGLDRHPTLRDAYFGNYRRLVYLAQTEDAELDARARRAAERLGLEYERRITGIDGLRAALAGQRPQGISWRS